jgi:hypothetical protein
LAVTVNVYGVPAVNPLKSTRALKPFGEVVAVVVP